MFKNFLFSLDKQPQDAILERLDKEPGLNKYWVQLGVSMMCLLGTIVVGSITIINRVEPQAPITYGVDMKAKSAQRLNTLPFPHQSFKNVSGWLLDAISASYSFDFSHFYQQVEKAGYYYTPDGYTQYIKALESANIDKSVINKKLEISVVPTQSPVMINGGTFGSTEFWRFRVPVITSYYGGNQPVVQKFMVEVLVIRVPAYQNPKGLAIAEFKMVPL